MREMEDPVDQLCSRCAGYFDKDADWVEDGVAKVVEAQSLDEVKSSAENGCHLYTTISQTVTLAANPGHVPLQQYRLIDESKIRLRDVGIIKDSASHGFQMNIAFVVDGHGPDVATIFLHPVKPYLDHEQTPGMEPIQAYMRPQVATSTDSQRAIDQIKKWASASESIREKKIWDRSSLPARLLDVGHCTDEDLVRLVSTTAVPADCQFMTLSYCWGSKAFIKLTLSTNNELVDGIKISGLPQTFQDAIRLTRSLEIRYLWIDALCIIQDSLEDFSKEARGMSNLYQRSWMTIAAIDSADCFGGLFRTRTSRSALRCIIQPTWTCFAGKSPLYAYHRGHYEEVTNKPFFCRGWILQELILSSRIVCFGESQVFWMSQSGYGSEAFPQFLPRKRNNIIRANIYDFIENHKFNALHPDFHRPLFIWHHILDSCIKKRLTFSRDKLIAVAGLADYMSAATKGTLGRYASGLWETALQYQLGWIVRDDFQQSRPNRPMPSFSWASVDVEPGGIVFPLIEVTALNSAECFISLDFEEGQPQDAVPSYSRCIGLKIRAPFEHLTISSHEIFIGSAIYQETVFDLANKRACAQWKIYWDTTDDALRATSAQLSAVVISTANATEHVALLLNPVKGGCCWYSRVGILRMYSVNRLSSMTDAFKKPSKDAMCELHNHKRESADNFWVII